MNIKQIKKEFDKIENIQYKGFFEDFIKNKVIKGVLINIIEVPNYSYEAVKKLAKDKYNIKL